MRTPPDSYSEVIRGKRYSIKNSTLLADDAYWDGHNMERGGRNTFLYKTAKGRYFLFNRSQWQGERDGICPIDKELAMEMWEDLPERYVEYAEAFNVEVEEA